MTSNVIPPSAAPFTPEDLASFYRVAVGWVDRGLCNAVRRTQVDGADILLVMRNDGSAEPLWAVEKHPDQTYWLVNRSRQALAFGAAMDEVLRYLDLPAEQAGAPVH
jgi:hypothetical protein